jgi:hypothetical protein
MDLRATLGYEAFKRDGMALFIETMTGADASAKLATDVQTLAESAWGQKGQAAGTMMLCRLVGYLEGMIGVVGGIHQAGVEFIPVADKDGKPASLRVKLYPGEGDNPSKPASVADLDDLDGPAYEAALAKMSDAERGKYLAEADLASGHA